MTTRLLKASTCMPISGLPKPTLKNVMPPRSAHFLSAPLRRSGKKLLEDPEIHTLPETLALAHRFIGHGNREWDTDLEEYDLTLGLQGKFADGTGYDLHARYYRHDTDTHGDTFVSESLARKAIREGRYNIEDPLSSDAVHQLAIRETGLLLDYDASTDHRTVRIAFDGSAVVLVGVDMRWAAGGA